MVIDKTSHNETPQVLSIWSRVRKHCLEKGLSISQLSQESGISRATLHKWQKGQRSQPHNKTLHKLAGVLGISPAILQAEISGKEVPSPPQPTSRELPTPSPFEPAGEDAFRRNFDRQTNWMIQEVCEQNPALFHNWADAEWDELFSSFGVGGELNEEGVLQQAEAINEKRETIYKLQVVLETHLNEAAQNVIHSLFEAVQCEGLPESGEMRPSSEGATE